MAKPIYYLNTGESVISWCRKNSIPYETTIKYINKGLLIEDACKKAKEAHENRLNNPTLMLNGQTLFSSLSKSAYVSVKKKMRKYNCGLEEALKQYTHNVLTGKKGKTKMVKDLMTGKIYMSIKECAKEKGIDPSNLSKAIKQGKVNIQYVQ